MRMQSTHAYMGVNCLADASARNASILSTIRGGHLHPEETLKLGNALATHLAWWSADFSVQLTTKPASQGRDLRVPLQHAHNMCLAARSCQTARSWYDSCDNFMECIRKCSDKTASMQYAMHVSELGTHT